MTFDPHSRSVLSAYDLGRFADERLFSRIARAVCAAECVPRKELFESWEVARRVRRRFRGGRVVDLACGHGLVAWIALILDPSSELGVAVDRVLPASAHALLPHLARSFPRAGERLRLHQGDLESFPLHRDDVVISAHGCGPLTDVVLARAREARARVAVLPCCHDLERCDSGGLLGWLEPALAIDTTRVHQLRAHGYDVHTQTIPAAITPKNRLLLGAPRR